MGNGQWVGFGELMVLEQRTFRYGHMAKAGFLQIKKAS